MTYRATPGPCGSKSDTTPEFQYMLANFSSRDVVDDRAARLVIGTPTRIDDRTPVPKETAKKTRREKVPSR
jgi:hypothetical protein